MSRRMSYDKTLFGAAILIVVVGLVMIYSASAIIAAQKSGDREPVLLRSPRSCSFWGSASR